MDKQDFRILLEKYLSDESTERERLMLFRRLNRRPFDTRWAELIDAYFADPGFGLDADPTLHEQVRARLLEAIRQQPQEETLAQVSRLVPVRRLPQGSRLVTRRWIAAAAVLLFLAAATWLLLHLAQVSRLVPVPPSPALAHDIAPGHNGAILTLSNGQTIVLDSAANGTVAQQGGTQVQKSNSRLEYVPSKSPLQGGARRGTTGGEPGVELNTLTTPRGRQYQLTLPDGTQVWLNAASSITYPTAFTGKDRPVSITGEAYFEIAHDAAKPFSVSINGGAPIEVLGTAFNINAYSDEPAARTTLLNGAVRVGNLILQPGEQASDDRSGRIDLVRHADVDQAVAWKNGLFQFRSASIESLMRQLSRWYDIKVDYPRGVPQGHITGKLPRSMSLATLEKALEFSGVHFTIEGNEIKVAP